MLAAVLKDFDNLVLEDVPVPEPGTGEVVVRIRACGFCATDYKAIKGIRRNVTFPFIPGHEPAGLCNRQWAFVFMYWAKAPGQTSLGPSPPVVKACWQ